MSSDQPEPHPVAVAEQREVAETPAQAAPAPRPTLAFLPWCRLANRLSVGPVHLVPYRRKRPEIPELDDPSDAAAVASVLSMYRDLHGEPVTRLALIRLDDQPLLAPLNAERRATINEWIKVVAFAALADRDIVEGFAYANAAHFALRFQEIVHDTEGDMTHIRRDVRTKYGGIKDGRKIDELRIGIPEQAASNELVRADRRLLSAIEALGQATDDDTWERWMDALACFVEANTDSQDGGGVPPRVDHVLLTSAFESLLQARGKAVMLGKNLDAVLDGLDRPPLRDSHRYTERLKRRYGKKSSVANAWVREFYDIRNSFGHGQRTSEDPEGPYSWAIREHELLATIAFPIIARKLLADAGHLRLTSQHRGDLAALEHAMASPYSDWAKLFRDAGQKETIADMGRARQMNGGRPPHAIEFNGD